MICLRQLGKAAAESSFSRATPVWARRFSSSTANESAGDLEIVSIVGVEAEQSSSYASLHRLLLPFLGNIDRLPPPQRAALECAFGLSARSPADLFLVGLAALTLLADAATPRGLLCIIDDAQLLDPESLQVMGFVARRLGAEGIALVFGFRTPSDGLAALAGLGRLEIAGLPDDAAMELLSRVLSSALDLDTGRRIVTETRGCPLALAELATEIAMSPRAGTSQLFDPIPIGPRLEAHFRRQAKALSPKAQLFLLIAAVEGSGDITLVRSVAIQLGCGAESADEALDARLLTTEPRLEFRHPLIRSAVYAGASPSDRVKVHRALAGSINRDLQPDRWARHAMAIATGPDEDLARDLEVAAHQARERGGFATEATMLTHAAEFSEEASHRSERRLKAASASMAAGMHHQAYALLTEARGGLSDPFLLARAQQLDGRLCVPLARTAAAPALLLDAAQQFLPFGADLARESLLEAFDTYEVSQHLTDKITGLTLAQAAQGIPRARSEPELVDRLLDGTMLLFTAGHPAAFEEFRQAARVLREGSITMDEVTRWHRYGTWIADEMLDDHTYKTWADHVERTAREMGALDALQLALLAGAQHQLRAGRFTDAEANYAEVTELALARGWPADIYGLLDVQVHTWRGNRRGDSIRCRRTHRVWPDHQHVDSRISSVPSARNS